MRRIIVGASRVGGNQFTAPTSCCDADRDYLGELPQAVRRSAVPQGGNGRFGFNERERKGAV